jgi:methyl-accepting chemotaxis protein
VSTKQLDQFQQLQSSLTRLFGTLQESSTKVETTATIGEDLYRVTGRLSQLMEGFSFNAASALQPPAGEKRRHPRLEHGLLMEVTQGSEDLGEGVAMDFSLTGVRLVLSKTPRNHEPLTLRMRLPANDLESYQRQSPLVVQGRIAWAREENGRPTCGVEFVGLGPDEQKQLRESFAYFNHPAEYVAA